MATKLKPLAGQEKARRTYMESKEDIDKARSKVGFDRGVIGLSP